MTRIELGGFLTSCAGARRILPSCSSSEVKPCCHFRKSVPKKSACRKSEHLCVAPFQREDLVTNIRDSCTLHPLRPVDTTATIKLRDGMRKRVTFRSIQQMLHHKHRPDVSQQPQNFAQLFLSRKILGQSTLVFGVETHHGRASHDHW